MDRKHQKILLTCILVVYALAMIAGAIIPNPSDIPVFSGNTKYFHFFGFIVLSVITLRTFDLYRFKHKYILSILALLFFVFLTEFLQLYVSTRHFAYTDMIIDIGGCIIGWGLYAWIYSKR
ncbi:MAG: VanZ family protein [Candidatus Woesearchaeota archaeon]